MALSVLGETPNESFVVEGRQAGAEYVFREARSGGGEPAPSGEAVIDAGLKKELCFLSMPGLEKSEFRYRYGARFGGMRAMRQFDAAS